MWKKLVWLWCHFWYIQPFNTLLMSFLHWELCMWILYACFVLRPRHVHIYQTLQPLSQREGLRLQTDVFWLWPCQERVQYLFLFLIWLCCMIISALLLIFHLLRCFSYPRSEIYTLYKSLSISVRIAHIPKPQRSCLWVGLAPSPPAWHWTKCIALLACRDEYRGG